MSYYDECFVHVNTLSIVFQKSCNNDIRKGDKKDHTPFLFSPPCSIRWALGRGSPVLLCVVASDSSLVYQRMTDGLVTPDPPVGPFQDQGRRQHRKRRQQHWPAHPGQNHRAVGEPRRNYNGTGQQPVFLWAVCEKRRYWKMVLNEKATIHGGVQGVWLKSLLPSHSLSRQKVETGSTVNMRITSYHQPLRFSYQIEVLLEDCGVSCSLLCLQWLGHCCCSVWAISFLEVWSATLHCKQTAG